VVDLNSCDLTNQLNSTPFVHRAASAAMIIRWCALSGVTRPAHLCHGQPALHLRTLPQLSIPRGWRTPPTTTVH
jgi:hypothetical protein